MGSWSLKQPNRRASCLCPVRLSDDASGLRVATVPDGTLIVAEDCDEDLSALADAIEARLQPPYRAKADPL